MELRKSFLAWIISLSYLILGLNILRTGQVTLTTKVAPIESVFDGSGGVGLFFIFISLSGIVSIMTQRKMMFLSLLLQIPIIYAMVWTMTGSIASIQVGHYMDGYVPNQSSFIFNDQIFYIVITIGYLGMILNSFSWQYFKAFLKKNTT